MTVRELIKQLSEFPLDSEAVFYDGEEYHHLGVVDYAEDTDDILLAIEMKSESLRTGTTVARLEEVACECLGTELPVLQTHDYRVRYYAFEEA